LLQVSFTGNGFPHTGKTYVMTPWAEQQKVEKQG